METRARHLIVGLFVISLLLGGFAFVRWSVDRGLGGSGSAYSIVFNGSVAGLTPGANVLFNGIKVGTVDTIAIDQTDSRQVVVGLRLRDDIPVRANSLASITQVGITGLAAIQISAGDPAAATLRPGKNGETTFINAKPMLAGSIMDAMPEVMSNVNALFVRLDKLVSSNEDVLSKSLLGLKSFTDVLAANKDDIGGTIQNIRAITDSFRTSADRMNAMINKIDSDLISGDRSVVEQAAKAVIALRGAAEKLESTVGGNAEQIAGAAKRSLQEIELLAKDGRRATRNFDRLLERVERNPQSLLWGEATIKEYKPQ